MLERKHYGAKDASADTDYQPVGVNDTPRSMRAALDMHRDRAN
jgi:hypothetical protein